MFAISPPKVFAATTYTVNSIGDDPDATPGDSTCETATPDECTLRAAIEEVNAGTGGDTINFGIAGSGMHTLTPASGYPTIDQSVTIDGYSQSGSSANTAISPNPFNGTLTIEIDGTSAGGGARGLRINASNVTVKGLVINSFSKNGIEINTANNVVISGNYIGTDPTGLIDRGNSENGVNYTNNGNGHILGGALPADRNVISGNGGAGLLLIAENSNLIVKGNYFGPDSSGTAVLPNIGATAGGANIWLQGGNNSIIGGSNLADSNVISGSPSLGVGIYNDTGVKIQGNYIGTDPQGNVQSGFGNSLMGVLLMGVANTMFGGVSSGEGNTVAGNGAGVGVSDIGGAILALNNSILGNSIHNNLGGSIITLGIDLMGNTDDFATFSDAGVTANDAGDPDVTSNVLMNFPVIQSVTSTNGTATISYSLDINDTEPGATGYRVEFFANDAADPSGHGQGQTYIGSDTVAGDVTGRQVTITLPDGVDGSKYITATATMTDASDDGFGHTSEFAENVEATLVAAIDPDGGDQDNISDEVENAAPNSGDANNDGTPDSEQSNVASFVDLVSGQYAVLEVSYECSVTSVSIDEESTPHPDPDFSYPSGLMDFTLECGTNGFTADVTQYYYGASGNFIVRKYNPDTKTYSTIDGAELSQQTIDSKQVTKATYQVKDGSTLDLDGEEDGNIHDPAGLAQTADTLANTGQNTHNIELLAIVLLTSGLAVSTYAYNKKPRKYNV